jgi:DNA primase
MLWIDVKYANMISNRLGRYSLKNNKPFLANFRCHYCGDSAKNKGKTRGYLIEKGGADFLIYFCHNCGKSTAFGRALKEIDPILYQEYTLEKLRETGSNREVSTTFQPDIGSFAKRRFEKFDALKALKKISQLPVDHPARKYVEKRKIPSNLHYKLYYSPKYMAWVNTIVPDKFSEDALKKDEPRLVIPFIDADGRVFAFQGRSFDPKSKLRYITIVLDDSLPRIYGLDSMDRTKDVIVVEGPIDATMIDNCVALAGGDNSDIDRVVSKDRAIFLFDNEPRNPDTIRRIEKAIDAGYRVSIFPESIAEKDPNEMIMKGMDREELSGIIFRNTYSGLAAKLRLAEWKKL